MALTLEPLELVDVAVPEVLLDVVADVVPDVAPEVTFDVVAEAEVVMDAVVVPRADVVPRAEVVPTGVVVPVPAPPVQEHSSVTSNAASKQIAVVFIVKRILLIIRFERSIGRSFSFYTLVFSGSLQYILKTKKTSIPSFKKRFSGQAGGQRCRGEPRSRISDRIPDSRNSGCMFSG